MRCLVSINGPRQASESGGPLELFVMERQAVGRPLADVPVSSSSASVVWAWAWGSSCDRALNPQTGSDYVAAHKHVENVHQVDTNQFASFRVNNVEAGIKAIAVVRRPVLSTWCVPLIRSTVPRIQHAGNTFRVANNHGRFVDECSRQSKTKVPCCATWSLHRNHDQN